MSLLYSQWNRMRCAYLVFEATHARLVHTRWTRPSFTGSARVYFEENETEVSGRAKCGAASETVTLKRLEEGSW